MCDNNNIDVGEIANDNATAAIKKTNDDISELGEDEFKSLLENAAVPRYSSKSANNNNNIDLTATSASETSVSGEPKLNNILNDLYNQSKHDDDDNKLGKWIDALAARPGNQTDVRYNRYGSNPRNYGNSRNTKRCDSSPPSATTERHPALQTHNLSLRSSVDKPINFNLSSTDVNGGGSSGATSVTGSGAGGAVGSVSSNSGRNGGEFRMDMPDLEACDDEIAFIDETGNKNDSVYSSPENMYDAQHKHSDDERGADATAPSDLFQQFTHVMQQHDQDSHHHAQHQYVNSLYVSPANQTSEMYPLNGSRGNSPEIELMNMNQVNESTPLMSGGKSKSKKNAKNRIDPNNTGNINLTSLGQRQSHQLFDQYGTRAVTYNNRSGGVHSPPNVDTEQLNRRHYGTNNSQTARGSRPAGLKNRRQRDKDATIFARDIEGHQGDKDITELLQFVEGNTSAPSSKPKKSKNTHSSSGTALSTKAKSPTSDKHNNGTGDSTNSSDQASSKMSTTSSTSTTDTTTAAVVNDTTHELTVDQEKDDDLASDSSDDRYVPAPEDQDEIKTPSTPTMVTAPDVEQEQNMAELDLNDPRLYMADNEPFPPTMTMSSSPPDTPTRLSTSGTQSAAAAVGSTLSNSFSADDAQFIPVQNKKQKQRNKRLEPRRSYEQTGVAKMTSPQSSRNARAQTPPARQQGNDTVVSGGRQRHSSGGHGSSANTNTTTTNDFVTQQQQQKHRQRKTSDMTINATDLPDAISQQQQQQQTSPANQRTTANADDFARSRRASDAAANVMGRPRPTGRHLGDFLPPATTAKTTTTAPPLLGARPVPAAQQHAHAAKSQSTCSSQTGGQPRSASSLQHSRASSPGSAKSASGTGASSASTRHHHRTLPTHHHHSHHVPHHQSANANAPPSAAACTTVNASSPELNVRDRTAAKGAHHNYHTSKTASQQYNALLSPPLPQAPPAKKTWASVAAASTAATVAATTAGPTSPSAPVATSTTLDSQAQASATQQSVIAQHNVNNNDTTTTTSSTEPTTVVANPMVDTSDISIDTGKQTVPAQTRTSLGSAGSSALSPPAQSCVEFMTGDEFVDSCLEPGEEFEFGWDAPSGSKSPTTVADDDDNNDHVDANTDAQPSTSQTQAPPSESRATTDVSQSDDTSSQQVVSMQLGSGRTIQLFNVPIAGGGVASSMDLSLSPILAEELSPAHREHWELIDRQWRGWMKTDGSPIVRYSALMRPKQSTAETSACATADSS